ncbi:envelope stress sensor histidine kinase CpxA [Otariodibacter sp.]|uniref:envelope stress sensor histidine kinase CpxA n=1 Tax=Otariodibacter sp. TaxID=3030919 RepID=UPI002602E2CB|nr:envelope stress sensor histidine kinase CpxA [Otariodibacter sp.]
MIKYWNKIKTLHTYFVYQIFVSFVVIVSIMIGIALILPNFDARVFNPIEKKEFTFFQNESINTQLEYNLDELFRRNLMVSSVNGFDVILFDPITQKMSGVTSSDLNTLYAFILGAHNPEKPLQRRFDSVEIYGPFVIESSSRSYYQYFIKHTDEQIPYIDKVSDQIFDSPILMLILLLFISLPLLLWLSMRMAKPVKALQLSADAVARGNLVVNPRLENEGIHELRLVGNSFNKMIRALQELTTYQQRLLSDISHELKTPLTRMQLAVSLLRLRNGESNELKRINNEIQKLDTMIHDLLSLSRDQLNQHVNREVFQIDKIWEDVFDDAKFEIEQNKLSFSTDIDISEPSKYYINGNVSMLSSAVENVIRNAQKYAKTLIAVKIHIEKTRLIITVDDDGIGVPENQYEEIFRPFARVQEDRARQTGGTGLGLAIVSNAISQHSGSVIAEKSYLGGLRIKIDLPLWIE